MRARFLYSYIWWVSAGIVSEKQTEKNVERLLCRHGNLYLEHFTLVGRILVILCHTLVPYVESTHYEDYNYHNDRE